MSARSFALLLPVREHFGLSRLGVLAALVPRLSSK